ncbi:Glucose N-acetyltransferase 1-A [Cyberlindnera fabianii]|uniref:Glucose N-acetyltransferase 1-A n=1 Tax=Cyberlindnera fabianii TaxID=36022 RepID=A0A1V2LCY0_CYBFA|nr:Glucose N-acetyltransferase 1-A [Cyberlindnera fabianii]
MRLETDINQKIYGFVSLTTQQRLDKISNWTDEHITPFLHTKTDYLPTVHRAKESLESDQQFLESRVNAKNFERYIYNNLPNYPATDIFKLTNIMMVIQPSAELADRVQYQLDHKGKNQYDMELVETMFDLPTMLSKQSNASLTNQPSVSFKERVNEDPEIMLIPWQRYEGVKRPKWTTKHCEGAKHWEDTVKLFRETRWNVCGLELMDSKR